MRPDVAAHHQAVLKTDLQAAQLCGYLGTADTRLGKANHQQFSQQSSGPQGSKHVPQQQRAVALTTANEACQLTFSSDP